MTLPITRHKKRWLTHLAASMWLLLPLLPGCGMRDGEPFFPSTVEPELSDPQYVTLDLRVGVNDGGRTSTRAFLESEDGSFEGPASIYEKVSTLRVVIVRTVKNKETGKSEDVVEHNRMVAVSDSYSDLIDSYYIINDDLRFKVVAGEDKQIYLFANEKAVSLSSGYDFSESLAVGNVFPENEIRELLMERTPGSAYIDNSQADTDAATQAPRYVPMSEFFEITVPEATGASEDSYTHTLFLTRSLIKFSFSVKLAPGDNTENLGMKLRGVKITNLANSCYYLPRNTVYNPPKYDESSNPLGGRCIDEFTTPGVTGIDGYEGSSCSFIFPKPLKLTVTGEETETYIYLPETKTNTDYQLSLLFSNPEDDDFYYTLYGSKPLQLNDVLTKDIPRNTHVKVNITLSTYDMSATVTLFPYTGVNLNPTFGF